jgi:hypothetical protein
MTDCVVVGAGPAGLAASLALAARGVDHVVLERGRAGESWRTQRWDSFRLNTVGWMNGLLGPQPRDAYLSGGEVVERLERLADGRPVREGVGVSRLTPTGDGFTLDSDAGQLRARTVVVATGDQNRPRRPALAGAFPDRVVQVHTAGYRAPGQLPDGAVLVVGSAQSGCQVTEDLLAAGRRVLLATSRVGRLPFRHRGRETVEWLVEAGFMDQRPADLPDPSAMGAAQTRVSAAATWTPRRPSPTSTTSPSTSTRRPRSTCAPSGSAASSGAAGSTATSPSSTRPWSPPTGRRAARTPPGPCPACGTWGCAGCAAAAPGSCSASPGTPPWSPTRSGPTWAAEAYRKAARPSAW